MEEKELFISIYEISKAVTSSTNYEKNLRYISNILTTLTGFDNVLIALKEEDSDKIKLFGNSKNITFEKGEGIIGKVWKHGIPIVINDITKEEFFLNKTKRNLDSYKNKKVAFIAVPIKIENEVLGVLAVDKSNIRNEPLDKYVKFLIMVGNILGQSIKLISKMEKEKRKLEEEKSYLEKQINMLISKSGIDGIIGKSKQILEIIDTIKKISNTSATVLLTGESGVGKEIFAKAIHNLSERSDKPFIKINCAAIPENLLESELFGYEKGAFTGANSTKKGKFELANGGTIFLDEIGDMPLLLQAKILRVLQEKEIERLGSTKPISIDVRIIAATNKNLEKMVYEGTFREDLYYRLNVISIHIPPLRERKEDIPLLIYYFLEKFNKMYGKNLTISKELLEYLQNYDWPGNVRQLQNTIERMVILSKHEKLDFKDLPADIKNKLQNIKTVDLKNKTIDERNLQLSKTVQEIEKEAIEKALKESGYVIKEAAKILGMTPRQIKYRIEKYNISFKK
ncbi:sigma 54-interacting transcriptional regulator [Sulfurihydrogenibium sp.]|uniref:sigma-54-dependent Fis family transcriptional regulator n=1 Tax=Sulfurihydrogenibium sp. TaxID=2053621 RepID=UPI002604CF7C|nr:sigma 54-interacting transcriptional regulator [Sulfurihydrogenibium sp.]